MKMCKMRHKKIGGQTNLKIGFRVRILILSDSKDLRLNYYTNSYVKLGIVLSYQHNVQLLCNRTIPQESHHG